MLRLIAEQGHSRQSKSQHHKTCECEGHPPVATMASPTTSPRTARRPYDRENPLPRRFKGVVAYDGTEYAGWQTQPSGRGVQDVLEARLSQLFGGRVHAAARGAPTRACTLDTRPSTSNRRSNPMPARFLPTWPG